MPFLGRTLKTQCYRWSESRKKEKKIYHARSYFKKGLVIVTSGRIGFRAKKFTRDKEGHYIIIKKGTKNM